MKESTKRALKKDLEARLLEGAQLIFEVPSTSDKGQHYTLTVALASPRFNMKCTCAGYQQFGEVCIHMGAVNLVLQMEANFGNPSDLLSLV